MNRQLLELARLYGIQTSYVDMSKQRRHADPEALLLVLRAMDAGVERAEDVGGALARRKEELRKRVVEPVMVAWDGELSGKHYDFGYHDAEINGQETFVISAPRKAYCGKNNSPPILGGAGGGKRQPINFLEQTTPSPSLTKEGNRIWGAFVPIYALYSKRNPNLGDLTDFENVMDLIASLGGTVMATLPLLAAFLDEKFEPSPYSPASRLFWNELYVDVTRVPEFEASAEAKRLAEQRPRKSKLVNYREEMAYKRRILEELARTFIADARPERLAAFGKFVRETGNVEDYARFRAGPGNEAAKNYHLFAQFVVQDQLRALSHRAASAGQMLYLDLPLGLHPEGYDIWRYPDLFVRGVTGGAPPDPVFTKGQNWAFPPMHPEAMRLNRYQYTIAYIRNHLQFARLLRIDHVMGLHRLYWIPGEFTGDKGVYVEYPAEELYAILSLESHRYKAGIVGENLGTVPPAVNAALARHNIQQMYVVQYEMKLRPPPPNCIASLNTHDMPPFRAFLDGLDIGDRVALGFLDRKAAAAERKQRAAFKKALIRTVAAVRDRCYIAGILRFLSDSMANIVLVNLEDLWDEVLPQNVPATNKERPNWRRRIRPSVEKLRRTPSVVKVLSDVFANRSRSLPL